MAEGSGMTNADYRAARKLFDDHVTQHKCQPLVIAQERGLPVCDNRRFYWENMIRVAGRLS